MTRSISYCHILLLLALAAQARAEPVTVRVRQGAVHGFLSIHSDTGANLGYGEFVQTASGDRVTVRNTLHFRDGSIDDETAVFLQRRVISFVSDHHVQHGPFFKNAIDAHVEANGQVSVTTTSEDGKTKQESSHIALPPDVSNGILGPMLGSISSTGPGVTVGMVLPIGKGRLIKLHVTPDSTGAFNAVEGAARTATIFRVRLDLGGIVGAIAPIVGKQPADVMLWVLEGPAPVVVREDVQLAEGSPIISIQLAGTTFPAH
jgi:hypothetical protein